MSKEVGMRTILFCAGLAFLCVACSVSQPAGIEPEEWALENGIRVVVVPMPESENVSVFTFTPMGLVWDGPGKTQWAHLVEHLVIRSTHPNELKEVNAETLPDHMRLDFYGTKENWRQGVAFHAEWLSGASFSEETLEREKRNANSECDFTAKNLATHKFAMAAWAQGYRHGSERAAVKGDVMKAELGDIQKYCDEGLAVLDRIVVCVVGGVEIEEVKSVAGEKLGAIASSAKVPAAVGAVEEDSEMTWDLPTKHLVLTWPIPEHNEKDYAALYVAAQMLQMRMFNDSQMKTVTGNVFAGADLATPEGNFLFINAVLQPGASFQDARKAIDGHIEALRLEESLRQAPMFGKQLAYQLTHVQDPAMLKKQAPTNMSLAMIEGNIGLQWGMRVFQYGRHRSILAENLSSLTAQDIKKAIGEYLSAEKGHALAVRPAQ